MEITIVTAQSMNESYWEPVHPFTICPEEASFIRRNIAKGSRTSRTTRETTSLQKGPLTKKTRINVTFKETKTLIPERTLPTRQDLLKTFVKTEFVVTLSATAEETFVTSNVRVKTTLVRSFSNGLSNDPVRRNLLIGAWAWKKAVVVSKTTVSPTVYFITTENKALQNLHPNIP